MGTSKTQTKAETTSKKERIEAVGTPAAESPMQVEPQREHEWLQKLVGEWTCEGETTMEAGKPPVKYEGTESVRSLGGLWIVAEAQGEMPGCGSSTSVMTLGFDPRRKRFVGTFLASMMTHLWLYEGTLDPTETILTLDTEGPRMDLQGELGKFRDVIEIKSDDYRVLTSHMLGDDGQWRQFMTAHYRRSK